MAFDAERTLADLRAAFRKKGSVLVAFSGGVDSAVLAKVGADELGDRSLAVIVDSESYATAEREAAVQFAEEMTIPHEVIFHSELADPDYTANPTNRCYFCRRGLADTLQPLAEARGFAEVAVGTNTSDLGEWRPGMQAIREAGLWQPFMEMGIDKQGVRELARLLHLPVSEKPSMACLSSRIPYGESVTYDKLRRIERAEAWFRERGFRQVRVRSFSDTARVEVLPHEIPKLREMWPHATAALREAGYEAAEIDERGYRSGSLSEGLLKLTVRSPADP